MNTGWAGRYSSSAGEARRRASAEDRPDNGAERVAGAAGVRVQERKAVDVVTGVLAVAVAAVWAVVSPAATGVRAGLARAGRLAGVLVPERSVAALGARGARTRAEAERRASAMLATIVRQVVEAVLRVTNPTDLVRRHVDLDALAREIDVRAVVDRVDLDVLAARLDLDAVAARLDLDAVVARVDPEPLIKRVDVDAVAARIDLEPLVARVAPDAVAERLDVDAVVARVDLDAVVARLDLPRIVAEVLAVIDLPEIVRESTGSAASEVVRDLRTESAHADDVVARIVDRLLHRQRRHPTEDP